MQNKSLKNRPTRGRSLTIDEFAMKYGLSSEDARRLFEVSGPSENDLDILMAAKGILPTPCNE